MGGGGSVMVWEALSPDALCDLIQISRLMKSVQCQAMLYDQLIPFGSFLGGANWMFQLDNVFCHVSKSTQQWFKKENNHVFYRSNQSTDLNPMENFWEVLNRKVYVNNKQFLSENGLEVATVKERHNIYGFETNSQTIRQGDATSLKE